MFFEELKGGNNYLKATKEQKAIFNLLKKGDIVLAKKQFSKKNLRDIDKYGRECVLYCTRKIF